MPVADELLHVSDGKRHDGHAFDPRAPEPDAFYVTDRGYVDFGRLYVLHRADRFFVTRAKSNRDFHRVYPARTDRSTGIVCGQTIALDGFRTKQDWYVESSKYLYTTASALFLHPQW